jgi:ubiquinone/menaquinone biosynthesis C-methylase UbiE
MSNPRISATIELLTKALDFKATRIVELGCGDGSLVIEVANALGAREVYGVDIDEAALKKAIDKGVRAYKSDLNSDTLPFEDNFFDVVLMEEVVEHLINPDNAISEAHRVLRDKGLFLVSSPNLAWWLNRLVLFLGYQPYWSKCSTVYNVGKFKRDQRQQLSGHLRSYTYRALRQLLELHGFEVIASKGVTYNNLPSIFKHVDRLLSKLPSLAQIVIILARKLEATRATRLHANLRLL